MSMFDQMSIPLLKSVIDYTVARQRVIASNVANANTPGYKSRDIGFENFLKSANTDMGISVRRTHPKHFSEEAIGESARYDTFYSYKPDDPHDGVNDVDLDRELMNMGEVQTNSAVFMQLLKDKYSVLKQVIAGT